jgi:hypothetical protein
MTCVWDALIKGIPIDDLDNILGHKKKVSEGKPKKRKDIQKEKSLKNNLKRDIFVKYLQKNAKKTSVVYVNDEELTETQINENFKAVQALSVNGIWNGYFCSTFDPFLILVCELFECSIYHKYLNSNIRYEHLNSKFIIYLKSSSEHMSYVRTAVVHNQDDRIRLNEKFKNTLDE